MAELSVAGVMWCRAFIIWLIADCSFALHCTASDQSTNFDFKATQVLHINLGKDVLPQCDLQNTTPGLGGKKSKDCNSRGNNYGKRVMAKVSK